MSDLLRAGRLAWAEGPRAALARWRDRDADARRAAAYREVSAETLAERCRGQIPVLNLIGVPLRRSSGGVELQFMARRAFTELERPTACLAPAAGGWRLEVAHDRLRMRIAFPPLAGEPAGAHLARAIQTSWALLAPRGLHVENPANLDLGELARTALRVPLLLSLHDFSLFCPRPHRLPVTAEGDCHWTAANGCASCETTGAVLAGEREQIPALLAHAKGLVFPSRFLRDAYERRLDGLERPPASIVEPAVDLRPRRAWRGTAAIRHVAYVGSVLPHKGAELLLAIAPHLAAMGVRVSAFGGGDRALIAKLRAARVSASGYYRAGSLPHRLVAEAVDLVLLLSLWPESHSLAFDECVTAGVPALAFDRGALGERLRLGGGVAVDPALGAPGILAAVEALRSGDGAPSEFSGCLRGPARSAAGVAAIYRDLGWVSS